MITISISQGSIALSGEAMSRHDVDWTMRTLASLVDAAFPKQQTFDVILRDGGDRKINVIKAVRTITNIGLKDAKDLVFATNARVLTGVSFETACGAQRLLKEEGATVDVVGLALSQDPTP